MLTLKIPRLILASASPRRADLLSQIGLTFEGHPSDIVEPAPRPSMKPGVFTQELALLKAKSVAKQYTEGVVIGADTLVSLAGELLGKPRDDAHAHDMLTRLSGTCHEVITGVALIEIEQQKTVTWSETTRVYFRKLSYSEIAAYVETGEPSDKAGAYGIQGLGAAFVIRIEGCYFNVVGLPLAKLVEQLAEFHPNDADT